MSATIHGLLLKGPMVRAALNSKLDTWPPVALDPGRAVKGWTRRVVTRHNSRILGLAGAKPGLEMIWTWSREPMESNQGCSERPWIVRLGMGRAAFIKPRIGINHLIYGKETFKRSFPEHGTA